MNFLAALASILQAAVGVIFPRKNVGHISSDLIRVRQPSREVALSAQFLLTSSLSVLRVLVATSQDKIKLSEPSKEENKLQEELNLKCLKIQVT